MTQIRPLTADDADFYAEIQNDPEVRGHIGRPLNLQPEECRERIRAGDGSLASLFIIETDEGTPIGICGFTENSNFEGTDTLIQIVTEHHGQGVGSDVLGMLINRWFDEACIHTLYATVSPRNAPAVRLLEKFNFQYDSCFEDILGRHFYKYSLESEDEARKQVDRARSGRFGL